MKLGLANAIVALASISTIEGLSLSYRWKASEARPCFYANVEDTNTNLQLYYSVSDINGEGGDSLVDVTIFNPRNQIVTKIQQQAHSETTINTAERGEYSICFVGAKPKERNVDIDMTRVNHDGSPHVPTKKAAASKADSAGNPMLEEGEAGEAKGGVTERLEIAIGKLLKDLTDLVHTLRYIRNREKRNIETVTSIENTVFYVSLFESALILGMSILQVTILRTFFSSTRRARV